MSWHRSLKCVLSSNEHALSPGEQRTGLANTLLIVAAAVFDPPLLCYASETSFIVNKILEKYLILLTVFSSVFGLLGNRYIHCLSSSSSLRKCG